MKYIKTVEIEISKLTKDQSNARIQFDNVAELVASLKTYGQKQPIIIRKSDDGDTFGIVEGNRRVLAFRKLKKEKIKADIYEMSDLEAMKYSVSESIERKNLTGIEERIGLARLLGNKKLVKFGLEQMKKPELIDEVYIAKNVGSKQMKTIAKELGITIQSLERKLEPLRWEPKLLEFVENTEKNKNLSKGKQLNSMSKQSAELVRQISDKETTTDGVVDKKESGKLQLQLGKIIAEKHIPVRILRDVRSDVEKRKGDINSIMDELDKKLDTIKQKEDELKKKTRSMNSVDKQYQKALKMYMDENSISRSQALRELSEYALIQKGLMKLKNNKPNVVDGEATKLLQDLQEKKKKQKNIQPVA